MDSFSASTAMVLHLWDQEPRDYLDEYRVHVTVTGGSYLLSMPAYLPPVESAIYVSYFYFPDLVIIIILCLATSSVILH